MRTEVILLILVLILVASCLCLGTPAPSEELVEKYGMVGLVLGFLGVVAMLTMILAAPILLFKKLW